MLNRGNDTVELKRKKTALLLAVLAGVYSLCISVILVSNWLYLNRAAPIMEKTAEELLTLSRENPLNESLRESYRTRDQEIRTEQLTSERILREGVWMLSGGVAVMLICLYVSGAPEKVFPSPEKAKAPSPDKESAESANLKATRTGGYVAGAGFVALIILLTFSGASKTPLDNALASVTPSHETSIADASRNENISTGQTNAAEAKLIIPSREEVLKNWPNFRGPFGQAIAYAKNIPDEWDGSTGKNIRFKVPVPLGGFNSPVIWNDSIFLSGANDERREVYCFSLTDGRLLWTADATNVPGSSKELPPVTEDTGYAAPTVATDGQAVFAIFGTGDICAFDFSGNRLWAKNLGTPDNHYGHSSSLITHNGKVLVQFDHYGESFLVALDPRNGQEIWKTKREFGASWSSPILAEFSDKMQVILCATPELCGYDAETGKLLWNTEALYGEVAPCATVMSGIVFTANEGATLVASSPAENKILWQYEGEMPDVCSPLAINKYVIMPTNTSVVSCVEAKTGTELWTQYFDEGFYSSPVQVGELVYLSSKDGTTYIFKPADEWTEGKKNSLGERILTTPAFADGVIVIRAGEHLFAISNQSGETE